MWDKVLLQNVILYSIILFKNTILKQPYKGVIGIRLCQFKLYNLMFFLFLLLNIHKMYHLINIDTCTHLCPFVSSPFLFPITLTPGPISIYFLSLNINLHFLETYISEITQNEFFFCLTSFTLPNCFEIHPSWLLLSSIPLYRGTTMLIHLLF